MKKEQTEKTIYRLASASMIHTPGIIRFLKRLYRDNNNNAIKILTEGYSLPEEVAKALLSGDVEYTLEDNGETVVIEYAKEEPDDEEEFSTDPTAFADVKVGDLLKLRGSWNDSDYAKVLRIIPTDDPKYLNNPHPLFEVRTIPLNNCMNTPTVEIVTYAHFQEPNKIVPEGESK